MEKFNFLLFSWFSWPYLKKDLLILKIQRIGVQDRLFCRFEGTSDPNLDPQANLDPVWVLQVCVICEMVNQRDLDWLPCLDKYRRVGAAGLVYMPNVGGVRYSRTLTRPRARFSTPTPSTTTATADTCLKTECQAWWVYLLFTHTSTVLEINTTAFIRGSVSLKDCKWNVQLKKLL